MAHAAVQYAVRRAPVVSEVPLSHLALRAAAARLPEIAAWPALDRRPRAPLRAPGRDLRVRGAARPYARRSETCFPGGARLAEFVWYAIYFAIGYIIPADGRFTEAFRRERWIGLPLWLIGFFGG